MQLNDGDHALRMAIRDHRVHVGKRGRRMTGCIPEPDNTNRICSGLGDFGKNGCARRVDGVIHCHLVHTAQDRTLSAMIVEMPAHDVEGGLALPSPEPSDETGDPLEDPGSNG